MELGLQTGSTTAPVCARLPISCMYMGQRSGMLEIPKLIKINGQISIIVVPCKTVNDIGSNVFNRT